MAILTIARELGSICDGEELALCSALNLYCINKTFLEKRFREMGVDRTILTRFDECKPKMSIFSDASGLYWESLQTVLMKELLNDNLAIIGRGGNFLLKNMVDCFRIRLIAPLEYRVRVITRECDCSEDAAIKAIRLSDSEREKFCRYYYDRSWQDPTGYDLIINTAEVPMEKIAALLPPLLPPSVTDARRSQLQLAVQEQIIRHALYSAPDFHSGYCNIRCLADGTVILSGDVSSGHAAARAEEIARSIPGVTDVKNELKIAIDDMMFAHIGW